MASEVDSSIGFNYDGWQSDENENGYQILLPVTIGTSFKNKANIQLLTGYAHTYADIDGTDGSGKVEGFLDTKLNLSYEHSQLLSLDWLFGLDFNLPTGKTGINEQDQSGLWDSDLVSVTRMGEGFNINPSISAAKNWNRWTAGLAIGYAFRGEYDYSDRIHDYDPGDIFNLAGELGYEFSPQWHSRFFAEYANFGKDKIDGDNFAREGDFWLFGMRLYHIQNRWEAFATLQSIFRGKSRFRQGTTGNIGTEQRNSHGDEWIAKLLYRYHLNRQTSMTTQFQYLFIDQNDYDNSSSYYIGTRQKGTLTLGLQHEWTQSLIASFQIKGFLMKDEENWRHPDEDRNYTGYSLNISLNKRF